MNKTVVLIVAVVLGLLFTACAQYEFSYQPFEDSLDGEYQGEYQGPVEFDSNLENDADLLWSENDDEQNNEQNNEQNEDEDAQAQQAVMIGEKFAEYYGTTPITGVTLFLQDSIVGMRFRYGKNAPPAVHGVETSNVVNFNLDSGDCITHISGTTDKKQLTFITLRGKQYGPYGAPGAVTTTFTINASSRECLNRLVGNSWNDLASFTFGYAPTSEANFALPYNAQETINVGNRLGIPFTTPLTGAVVTGVRIFHAKTIVTGIQLRLGAAWTEVYGSPTGSSYEYTVGDDECIRYLNGGKDSANTPLAYVNFITSKRKEFSAPIVTKYSYYDIIAPNGRCMVGIYGYIFNGGIQGLGMRHAVGSFAAPKRFSSNTCPVGLIPLKKCANPDVKTTTKFCTEQVLVNGTTMRFLKQDIYVCIYCPPGFSYNSSTDICQQTVLPKNYVCPSGYTMAPNTYGRCVRTIASTIQYEAINY